MKILIYGAGIQGSYLAHSLAQNSHNQVIMLARNKRLAQLRSDNLVLYHQLQKKRTVDRLTYVEQLNADDFYDIIFVTMKYSDFESVLPVLAANMSENIIFVGNQMDTLYLETQLMSLATSNKNVSFGFQTTGGTRKEDLITILRFGKGKLKINSSVNTSKLKPILEAIFSNTSYTWEIDKKLDDWLKTHAALVTVLNTFDKLQTGISNKKEKKELMRLASLSYKEAFQILKDNGVKITPPMLGTVFSNAKVAYSIMKLIFATPIMKMQEGDFREIEVMIESLLKFQKQYKTLIPNFSKLLAKL